MQPVYSAAPADWATIEQSYLSVKMQPVYSAAPADWATIVESYPSGKDAAGIFCSSSRLSHDKGVLPPL